MISADEEETKVDVNPGSDEAIDAGCKCPVLDNGHGRGLYTDEKGERQFVIAGNCPLHGFE